jgi:hypothetical protein
MFNSICLMGGLENLIRNLPESEPASCVAINFKIERYDWPST